MSKKITVLLLYNPTNEIRGKMRRYFYETKPNVFIGTISKGVRDTLWNELQKTDIQADLIYTTNNEQGYEFLSTREDAKMSFEEFNGLTLPTKISNKIDINDLYAKLNPAIRLIDHMKDVGYIAEALMYHGRAFNMITEISKKLNISFDKLAQSICWLCALHDIGKAHPYFIYNMYSKASDEVVVDIFQEYLEKGIIKEGIYEYRHERGSRDIIKAYFKENNLKNSIQFANIITYHHQGKNTDDFMSTTKIEEDWQKVHQILIKEIEKEWVFQLNDVDLNVFVNGLFYCILSIMVTSDWIASGKYWQELVNKNLYKFKRDIAKEFIEIHYLSYKPIKDLFKDINWDNAFDFKQNELQSKIIDVSKTKPQIMFVEYPCGGGKTEAAISAAKYMGADKSGIYIAMPTMATAKNMSIRMSELSKKVNLNINIPEFDSSALWNDDDMIKIPKELWTSKSRHRLLYPFAVGTIDQILKTMIHYRYGCIGLTGLSDKIIIVDEVHAYDMYMLTELAMLIKWCTFLNVPIILLSATLPSVTKDRLLKAVGYKESARSDQYPLITSYSKENGLQLTPVNCIGKKFKLNIQEVSNCTEAFKNVVSLNQDGCSAFIERTVDDTWKLYNYAKDNSINSILFQGRDVLIHKEQKTKDLITLLGKNRENRPKNLSLIATPIIEQSLDIDLDRMYTALAPIDLLIQRFGRVQRHSDIGTIRENQNISIPITIFIPDDYDRLTYIYNREILEKTHLKLSTMTEIDTVKDARDLIDFVYDNLQNIEKDIRSNMKANAKVIDMPFKDENTILDNNSQTYELYKDVIGTTREEGYPTVTIAIVDSILPDDIQYDQVRELMLNNVLSISLFKFNEIKTKPLQESNNKFLKDIIIFLRKDLKKEGIELTEDGLKWKNN